MNIKCSAREQTHMHMSVTNPKPHGHKMTAKMWKSSAPATVLWDETRRDWLSASHIAPHFLLCDHSFYSFI